MRPRVFPAEDPFPTARQRRQRLASMRPRVFPAEDEAPPRADSLTGIASMRPRVFPAEDARLRWAPDPEAAALQ